jgi:rhamnulokinase
LSKGSPSICTLDFGLLDINGELLGNPYHYRDPQTQGLIKEVTDMIGEDELFLKSGLQLMPFNTIYQLYAMKKADSPKLEQAQTLLLTPDLLNYFLTGQKACEFTMATTTQLFQPDLRVWNTPLMEQLGIPASLFIAPIQPGTLIGSLTEEICQELNVPAIHAVTVGSHDTESAIAAVPTDSESFAYLVCGTWSLLGTQLNEALLTPEARELNFSNEGGVGNTFQLLKNIMGLWLLQEYKRKWDRAGDTVSFSDLVGAANDAEPFRSLIDPDDLRFLNPVDMENEVIRYCEETAQPLPRNPDEVARCILESLALRYRSVLEQVEELSEVTFQGLYMVGGGIQNELLCQFTANAIGRPVWTGPIEASAIGNLLVQFQSSGDLLDLQEGSAIIKRSFPMETYKPVSSADWHKAYEKYRQVSRSI